MVKDEGEKSPGFTGVKAVCLAVVLAVVGGGGGVVVSSWDRTWGGMVIRGAGEDKMLGGTTGTSSRAGSAQSGLPSREVTGPTWAQQQLIKLTLNRSTNKLQISNVDILPEA